MPESPGSPTLPERAELVATARRVLETHWRPEGYTVPSAATYPHQWLWDSCFHAVVWAHLGEPDRAVSELRCAFAHQHDDGFVPHLTYWSAPDQHAAFWGRPLVSVLTQPPLYGHALAELARLGHPPPPDLVAAGVAGIEHLAGRRNASGLVVVFHPWETGCDDAPRFDSWYPGGYDPVRYRERKGELVAALVRSPAHTPLANPEFCVGSVGFNALVGFNARELATVADAASAERLVALAAGLRVALSARFDDELGCEHDWSEPYRSSSGARTLDAMLGVLLEDRPESRVAAAQLAAVRSPGAFGGRCGPAGVHRDEPAFDPSRYWRGPAWPQLGYLFVRAAERLGRSGDAEELRTALQLGAATSGFAEYWHPDTGAPGGAVPQSWAALAAIV